ncbi:MATE family efflux transporter [Bradyrhizobium diazoefficiens]|nr:MATE family efflux transporter [Bradyrhizobium diazoefficiens]MBR0701966.1 MATE family efflux transporter [Bradyrhizobium diazoefficiens]MBR0770389.1 MATE family efflux transporter [Bradyrhizobium diazoefficiens]
MAPTYTISAQSAAEPPKVALPAVSPRTRAMLEGAILPTMLRLIVGNLAVIVVQAALVLMEAYYISWLGYDAVAGITLVVPLVTLMLTMSTAGIGGGVSAVVAQALGARRLELADAAALHAIILGILFGLGFTAAELLGGPALFRAMGATGGALEAAVTYGGVFFAGMTALWLYNILTSILRGAAILRLPSLVTLVGAAVTLILSPALIMGWGPLPQLGIVGAGLATVIFYVGATTFLAVYILSGRTQINPLRCRRIELRVFWQVLRIGLPAAANNLVTSGTLLLIAWLVAHFGTEALAGYGIGSRLEGAQIPVFAGIGTAVIAMVGANMGAGQVARAERIAWIGAGLAAGVSGAIGVFGFSLPAVWIGLFSSDPAVLDAGIGYLRTVAPAFPFVGIAGTLFFASLGAGRPFWPLFFASTRLVVAVGGGALAGIALGGGLEAVYAAINVGLIIYGGGTALAFGLGSWRRRTA